MSYGTGEFQITHPCGLFLASDTFHLDRGMRPTKDEIAEYQKVDPMNQVLEHIKKKKWATEDEIQAIQDKIKGIVKEAVDFAEESPFPSTDALYKNVYVEDYPFIKE